MSARTIWLLRIALFGAVAFAVTMALLPHPPEVPIESDKAQHMLAFATIALLAALAYPRMRLVRIGERLSFLGALVEVLQSIPSLHRDCDIHDWVADTIAIIVVLVIVATIRRRSNIVGKTIH
jgi:VanZ family protein